MCIDLGGSTVRRPSCVCDSDRPVGCFSCNLFGNRAIRPASFDDLKTSAEWIAIPAESYPEYSSFAQSVNNIWEASFCPIYPTIPHWGNYIPMEVTVNRYSDNFRILFFREHVT